MSTDDFWDDCQNEPRIEDSELTCKYKLTYNLLTSTKPSPNQKHLNAIEHCKKMYSKGKKKSLLLKRASTNQTRNIYSIDDIEECTWKPKLNQTQSNFHFNKTNENYDHNNKLKRYNSQTIYQRGLTHLHNHMQSINYIKQMKDEHLITSSPFKPMLRHKTSLSKVFGSNNRRVDQNDSLNLFFYRYKRARIKEEEKKAVFESNKLHNRKDQKRISKVSRSLSTKESYYMKRSLHEELLSIGNTQEY